MIDKLKIGDLIRYDHHSGEWYLVVYLTDDIPHSLRARKSQRTGLLCIKDNQFYRGYLVTWDEVHKLSIIQDGQLFYFQYGYQIYPGMD